MSILIDNSSRIVVQGITGRQGGFHSKLMMEYGSNVVGGVTPGRGGEWFESTVPIFDTVSKAVDLTGANVSMIMMVPAPFAPDAIIEVVDAGIELVVCLTEHIPVQDMMRVYQVVQASSSRLIGPNCPGLLTPGECKVGIMPGSIATPGNVGVVSKSGTLTYEVVFALTNAGMGRRLVLALVGPDYWHEFH